MSTASAYSALKLGGDGRLPTPVVRALSLDGDGATFSANVNHAVTAGHYELRPAAGERWVVARLIAFIQDTGAFDAPSYGNGITLTNGLELELVTGTGAGAAVDAALFPLPITSNSRWAMYAYDTRVDDYGVGDISLVARLTFSKFAPIGLCLDGDRGEALRVKLTDDYSGLTEHLFIAEGWDAHSLWGA